MAVSILNAGAISTDLAGASPFTYAFTTSAGAGARCLIAIGLWQNTGNSPSTTCTYGGVSMTAVAVTKEQSGIGLRIFRLLEADWGSPANSNIVFTTTGDPTDHMWLAGICFDGVGSVSDYTSGAFTNGGTQTATPANLTASDMSFAAMMTSDTGPTLTAGTVAFTNSTGHGKRGATNTGTGAISWSVGAGEFGAWGGIRLVVASAGGLAIPVVTRQFRARI